MTHDDSRPPKTFRELLAGAVSAIGRRLEGSTVSVNEVVSDEIRAAQFALLSAEADFERSMFTVEMLRCRLKRLRQTHGCEDYSPAAVAVRHAPCERSARQGGR